VTVVEFEAIAGAGVTGESNIVKFDDNIGGVIGVDKIAGAMVVKLDDTGATEAGAEVEITVAVSIAVSIAA